MVVIINGEENSLGTGDTLAAVVRHFGLVPETVVLEYNGSIVKPALWEQTALSDGDRIELISFVGGG